MPAQGWTKEQMKEEYPLYPYEPSKILPMITAGIFAIGLFYHLFISFKFGAFKYWWAFCLGLFAEVVGFGVRRYTAEYEHYHGTRNLGMYSVTTLCIVLAPAFFAASMYASYGRVMAYVGNEFSWIKRPSLLFVGADVLSIVIQGIGSSMFTSTNADTQKTAKMVLVIGFIIQLVAFALFTVTSIMFFFKAKRANVPTAGWRNVLFGLWAACALIFVRSIFRTLEFSTGGHNDDGTQSGFLLTNETVFYLFEAVACAVAVLVLSVLHPAFFLPRNKTRRSRPSLPPRGSRATKTA